MPKTSDRGVDKYPELAERRREIAQLYAASLLGMIKKGGATMSLTTRQRVLDEIFLLNPDHAGARAANREVKMGSRWVLEETRTAATQRRQIRTWAREALANAPKQSVFEPTKEEQAFGVKWKAMVAGSGWRMLSSAPAYEAPNCLRVADATDYLFERVFEMGGVMFPGRRIMMTDDRNVFHGILRRAPGMTPKRFEHSKGLGSTWLPDSNTFVAGKSDAEARLEVCSRQPLGMLFKEYFNLSTRHGWAWEGFGLYLTHKLTGYRRSTFVRVTRYATEERNHAEEKLWAELAPIRSNWFAVARRRIDARATPDWKLMLAKDVNQMEMRDLLFSYMLSAYLAEAHTDKLPDILKEIGENKDGADVLQRALGMPLALLAQRVNRWVLEHRGR
jgi:hypothetical protein